MFGKRRAVEPEHDVMAYVEALSPVQSAEIRKLKNRIEPELDGILSALYDSMARHSDLSAILDRSSGPESLKKSQVRHWNALLFGSIDQAFRERARRIGAAHVKAGLQPTFYIASYGFVIERLLTALLGPGSRSDLATGLVRAAMVDMAAALSAYVDVSETEVRRKEMDQMAQAIEEEMNHATTSMGRHTETLKRVVDDVASAVAAVETGVGVVDGGSVATSTSMSAVASAVEELLTSSREVGRQAGDTSRLVGDAIGRTEEANALMGRLSAASSEVRKVVELINDIARQTNLLALNATIEAARAGPAGRGFAVVAQEVKQLSERTETATKEIAREIADMTGATGLAARAMDEVVASVREIDQVARGVSENASGQLRALQEVAESAQRAASGAGSLKESVGVIQSAIGEAERAKSVLVDASTELGDVLRHLDGRLTVTVRSFASLDSRKHPRIPVRWPCTVTIRGRSYPSATVEVSLGGCLLDKPADAAEGEAVVVEFPGIGRIEAAVVGEQALGLRLKFGPPDGDIGARLAARLDTAAEADRRICEKLASYRDRIARDLERALADRRLTEDALFDVGLEPIAGTNPPQYRSRSLAVLEQFLPACLDEALGIDPSVVFCVATDRNGYLPCHNSKYSKPQGDDPVWNAANARNRRVFDDRTGLSAARSLKPVLSQTYVRQLGGGQQVLMKDLSMPIHVGGRQWGALRLGLTLG